MFQELYDKRIDIFIALVTGLLTGLVVLAIDRATKGKEARHTRASEPTGNLSLSQIISLSVDIRMQQPVASGAQPMAAAFVAAALTAYVFNRDAVLSAALLGSMLLVGIWLSVILFSLCAGHAGGLLWPAYLMLMIAVIATGAMYVVASAMVPVHAPPGFDQWQGYVNSWGLLALLKAIGPPGVLWLIGHVAGMLAFFVAIKDAALSMIFYALVGSGHLGRGGRKTWLIRATAFYGRRPYRRLMVIAVLLALAYYLVNGTAVIWLFEQLPQTINEFIRRVMFGHQSG